MPILRIIYYRIFQDVHGLMGRLYFSQNFQLLYCIASVESIVVTLYLKSFNSKTT